jgi:hypothetical protein
VMGLFKAELVRWEGPWRGLDDLELDPGLGRLVQPHQAALSAGLPNPRLGPILIT